MVYVPIKGDITLTCCSHYFTPEEYVDAVSQIGKFVLLDSCPSCGKYKDMKIIATPKILNEVYALFQIRNFSRFLQDKKVVIEREGKEGDFSK